MKQQSFNGALGGGCLRLKGSAAEILSLRKATLSALALRVYMLHQLLLKFARVRSIMEYFGNRRLQLGSFVRFNNFKHLTPLFSDYSPML
jgi:hypothetical protein